MTDTILTIVGAIGLGACLVAATLDHARRDDDVRADLTECRYELALEREVADTCMAVVEECRAVVEGHACACWRPE